MRRTNPNVSVNTFVQYIPRPGSGLMAIVRWSDARCPQHLTMAAAVSLVQRQ